MTVASGNLRAFQNHATTAAVMATSDRCLCPCPGCVAFHVVCKSPPDFSINDEELFVRSGENFAATVKSLLFNVGMVRSSCDCDEPTRHTYAMID
jgi:hypothetical protein